MIMLIIISFDCKKVECKIFIRKFGITNRSSVKKQDILNKEYNQFMVKIDFEQQIQHKRKEETRKIIFRNYLLSRVSGAIFKDFNNRI